MLKYPVQHAHYAIFFPLPSCVYNIIYGTIIVARKKYFSSREEFNIGDARWMTKITKTWTINGGKSRWRDADGAENCLREWKSEVTFEKRKAEKRPENGIDAAKKKNEQSK